jgi:hypothetical protein
VAIERKVIMNSSVHTIDVFLPICWNNRQLAQLRLDWERKSINSWHLLRSNDASELIVLVQRTAGYSLNRYFYSDGRWHVSLDVRDASLDAALSHFEAQP